MKQKILIAFIFIALLFQSKVAMAVTPTPTLTDAPTPSVFLSDKIDKIKQLKDKLATKVAELRQNEKKALFGIINTVDKDTAVLQTGKQKVDIETTEDTLVYTFDSNANTKDSSFSKIKKDMNALVLGYYDDVNKSIDSRVIYLNEEIPIHLIGKVVDIDRKNYTVTVKTASSDDWIIDIETYTKTQIYSKSTKLQKGGFSKIQPNDVIHVALLPDEKEKNRGGALRILMLSDFSTNNTVLSPTPTPTTITKPTSTEK